VSPLTEYPQLLPLFKSGSANNAELALSIAEGIGVDLLEMLQPYESLLNGQKATLDNYTQLFSSRELNWSNLQLETLPKELAELECLENLNLLNNQLRSIDDSLLELSNIKQLNLNKNKLSKLPENLKKWTALENLNLADNNIKELPLEIAYCQALQDLNLSRNQLKE